MSFLNIFKGNDGEKRKTTFEKIAETRSFNLGQLGASEVSIWLEIRSKVSNQQLVVKIKNEGVKTLTELGLTLKTTSGVIVANRGEVFGTPKNRVTIKNLPIKKSLIYSTRIEIVEGATNPSVTVSITKNSKQGVNETLSASLVALSSSGQLGA